MADDDSTRPTIRKNAKRAFRTDAANAAVGVREVAPGRWSLPDAPLDTWLVARAVPGHHRAGFRAWIHGIDAGRSKRRAMAEWDVLYGRYLAAPT